MIVVNDPAIQNSISEVLDFQLEREIRKHRFDPADDVGLGRNEIVAIRFCLVEVLEV